VIYNLLQNFKKAYEIKGDDLIIENHNLKEGLYIRVNNALEFEHFIVKKDCTKDKLFEWFRKADFYSCIINTNKSVADKKIHSCNYLSLFIKKKILIGDEKETLSKDVILQKITNYFDKLYGDDYNSEKIAKDLGKEIDEEKYNFCRDMMINGYDKIYSMVESLQGKFDNYIKIFFDFQDWEIYELESSRYLYQKVFNSDKYNLFINDKLFGLSNMNMGLNAKKPFLEHKTLRCKVPFMISAEDALLLFKYSLWLKNNRLGSNFKSFDYDYTVPLSESNTNKDEIIKDSFYLYFSNKNGEIEISDFDIIPSFHEKIDFYIKNYIKASYYNRSIDDVVVPSYNKFNGENRADFLAALDENLYIGKLKESFKTELKDIKSPKWGSKKFCNILILTKQQIFDFVNKNAPSGLRESVDKYLRFLILENIKLSKKRGIDACNTYIALKIFFDLGGNEKVQEIKEIRSSMGDYIKNKDVHNLDDIDQYSYLAGQIAYYLMSQSNASNRNHDVIQKVLNYTNVEAVNGELKYWFKRYAHAIPRGYEKFNRAFAMVIAHNKGSRVDEDLFLAGYLGDNIFYEGKEE
jgi:CRISPR-associated protein Csh1